MLIDVVRETSHFDPTRIRPALYALITMLSGTVATRDNVESRRADYA
jgi:hypothetical protein